MRRFPACVAAVLALCGPLAADLIVTVRDKAGKTVAHVAVPEGGSVVTQEQDAPAPGPAPTPGPAPAPPPGPTPAPAPDPAPKPVTVVKPAFAVVLKDRATLTPKQAAVIGPATEAAVERLGVTWRVYDAADATDVRQPASTMAAVTSFVKVARERGVSLPALLVMDSAETPGSPGRGRVLAVVPLPKDAAAAAAAVQQAVGGK